MNDRATGRRPDPTGELLEALRRCRSDLDATIDGLDRLHDVPRELAGARSHREELARRTIAAVTVGEDRAMTRHSAVVTALGRVERRVTALRRWVLAGAALAVLETALVLLAARTSR